MNKKAFISALILAILAVYIWFVFFSNIFKQIVEISDPGLDLMIIFWITIIIVLGLMGIALFYTFYIYESEPEPTSHLPIGIILTAAKQLIRDFNKDETQCADCDSVKTCESPNLGSRDGCYKYKTESKERDGIK